MEHAIRGVGTLKMRIRSGKATQNGTMSRSTIWTVATLPRLNHDKCCYDVRHNHYDALRRMFTLPSVSQPIPLYRQRTRYRIRKRRLRGSVLRKLNGTVVGS